MQILGSAKKVSIYIGESDKWERKPLYQAILELLKTEDCAGATVTRALSGFGAHSRIHTASVVALSADLPLKIEWIDSPVRVNRVMPKLRKMVIEGLITAEDVEVVAYSHRSLRSLPADMPVRDIMHREVSTVSPGTPLVHAMNLLLNKIYRALPVVDVNRKVVGILTEGDLLRHSNLPNASVQLFLTDAELQAQLHRLQEENHTVAEAMTAPAITVTDDTPITEAMETMLENDIKRLPVVDADGKLQGVFSRVDILRALAQPPVAALPRQSIAVGTDTTVGEVMLISVPSVKQDAPLAKVVDLLLGTSQRRVVVVDDERHVVGIITDGDLLTRATEAERGSVLQALSSRLKPSAHNKVQLEQRTAKEVMTPNPITVHKYTPLTEALKLLLEHQIKRLPVVDADGRLVGLVGRAGVLLAISQQH